MNKNTPCSGPNEFSHVNYSPCQSQSQSDKIMTSGHPGALFVLVRNPNKQTRKFHLIFPSRCPNENLKMDGGRRAFFSYIPPLQLQIGEQTKFTYPTSGGSFPRLLPGLPTFTQETAFIFVILATISVKISQSLTPWQAFYHTLA